MSTPASDISVTCGHVKYPGALLIPADKRTEWCERIVATACRHRENWLPHHRRVNFAIEVPLQPATAKKPWAPPALPPGWAGSGPLRDRSAGRTPDHRTDRAGGMSSSLRIDALTSLPSPRPMPAAEHR